MGKYVIRASSEGFNFLLVSENEQVILTSEIFPTIVDCKSGITQAKSNYYLDNRYKLKKSEDGKYCFILLISNRKPIGISELFDSVSLKCN